MYAHTQPKNSPPIIMEKLPEKDFEASIKNENFNENGQKPVDEEADIVTVYLPSCKLASISVVSTNLLRGER